MPENDPKDQPRRPRGAARHAAQERAAREEGAAPAAVGAEPDPAGGEGPQADQPGGEGRPPHPAGSAAGDARESCAALDEFIAHEQMTRPQDAAALGAARRHVGVIRDALG